MGPIPPGYMPPFPMPMMPMMQLLPPPMGMMMQREAPTEITLVGGDDGRDGTTRSRGGRGAGRESEQLPAAARERREKTAPRESSTDRALDSKTLLLEGVPPHLNTVEKLSAFYRRFGRITDIRVRTHTQCMTETCIGGQRAENACAPCNTGQP